MFKDASNVGFTSTDTTGMSQTEGIASIAGEKLILEHQTRDAFLGLLQSSIKIVEIPVQHLSNIRL